MDYAAYDQTIGLTGCSAMARGSLGSQLTEGCAEQITPWVLNTLMGVGKEVLFGCTELLVYGDKEIIFRSVGPLWKLAISSAFIASGCFIFPFLC